jgi:hypothetical protein
MKVLVRFVDEEHWYRWTWSVDRRAMWEAIPEQQRDAVRARAYEALESCRFGDGRIGFDQEAGSRSGGARDRRQLGGTVTEDRVGRLHDRAAPPSSWRHRVCR